MRRAQKSDLFVDSYTYNAHTTSVDTLWGATPVVAKPGATMCSRLSAGVLHAVGTPELIMRNEAEYASRFCDRNSVRNRVWKVRTV